jgi:uncharacterized repeat protein (TIGR03833 family)
MDNQYLKNIKKCERVEILTKQNKIVRGFVEDIAVTKEYDPKGIIVRLSNGSIGRVQKIYNEDKKDSETLNLIKKGENFNLEFKSSALWSINLSQDEINSSRSYEVKSYKERASKIIITKSICSFLNSEGGKLIIGVKENKDEKLGFEIIGINDEIKKLKDKTLDGYRRMIIDEIIKPYFPARIYNHLNQFIGIIFEEMDTKIVCMISAKKSEFRVFLKINDKEIFMIRTDTENRMLEGEKLVDYCIRHFRN